MTDLTYLHISSSKIQSTFLKNIHIFYLCKQGSQASVSWNLKPSSEQHFKCKHNIVYKAKGKPPFKNFKGIKVLQTTGEDKKVSEQIPLTRAVYATWF